MGTFNKSASRCRKRNNKELSEISEASFGDKYSRDDTFNYSADVLYPRRPTLNESLITEHQQFRDSLFSNSVLSPAFADEPNNRPRTTLNIYDSKRKNNNTIPLKSSRSNRNIRDADHALRNESDLNDINEEINMI